MKMMVIIYHKTLEVNVQHILEEHGVTSYTENPRVLGAGEAGKVEDTRHRPGYNGCIFAAMAEDKIEPVSRSLHDLAETYKGEYGRPAGLRAFALPCEQTV